MQHFKPKMVTERALWARSLAAVSMVTLVVGCGKHEPNKFIETKAPGQVKVTPAGTATQKVIDLKYKTAFLKCELRAPNGVVIAKSTAADTSFSWDLLKDFSTKRTYELGHSFGENHTFKVTLNVTAIQILSEVEVNADPTTIFKMQRSPVAEVAFEFVNSMKSPSGTTVVSSGKGRTSVHEAVSESVVQFEQATDVADAQSTALGVFCQLATELKDEFKNNIVIVKSDKK